MKTTPAWMLQSLLGLAVLLLATLLQACGGGDDCEAGTGTFKPLPEECEKPKTK